MSYAPHSVAAEQTLIGMLMADNAKWDVVGGRLKPEDFFIPLHADCFRLCGELLKANLEFCPPVVAVKLDVKYGGPDEVVKLLVDMFIAAGNSKDIGSVAFVVSECAMQRRMIAISKELTGAAEANRVEDAEKWQRELSTLGRSFSGFVPVTAKEQIKQAIADMHDKARMMKTGLDPWDRVFGGMFREKLYVIAGHGGAGKSALAVNLAWNMAKGGHKVRWVSWEENASALWSRILAREGRVNSQTMREAGLSFGESNRVVEAGSAAQEADFLAYYKLKDYGQIMDACGRCDLIVIDGLSRAPVPSGITGITDRVHYIMGQLNELSMKTGATILILSHLNGESVKGGASISGLYGGQAATFDPEGIVDIRRADEQVGEGGKRAITLTVLKNRYGREGVKVPLWFEGEYQNFYEMGGIR